MMRSLAVLIGSAVVAMSACQRDCYVVGSDIHPPAATTVALHESVVLQASSGGECLLGPGSLSTGPHGVVQDSAILMPSFTHWRSADSTIVSIVVLDASHARITGAAVGTAAVIAFTTGSLASTTIVTVR